MCVDQRTQPDAAMLASKCTEAGILAHLASEEVDTPRDTREYMVMVTVNNDSALS